MPRGFAAMDPEKRRAIARRGGAAVPGEKRSFATDRELAASAGRKGGEARTKKRPKVAPEPPSVPNPGWGPR